jgi:hypothetical protein
VNCAGNANKIGLSFGGSNNFAFGCGVDAPSVAMFKPLDFVAAKKQRSCIWSSIQKDGLQRIAE